MLVTENSNILDDVIKIAKMAGEIILDIYNSNFNISYKKNNSPVTTADRKANEFIKKKLLTILDIPVLSEEEQYIPFLERKNWELFWLIDPLDGTKEFINGEKDFTVNIALIYKNSPILGVVYAPALDLLYYGGKNIGSFKIDQKKKSKLCVSNMEKKQNSMKKLSVVTSKSHLNLETKNFIEILKMYYNEVQTVSIGSSLKFCLIADGKADIYPRLAPTMEWDTAAAHSILKGVQGKIVEYRNVNSLNDLKFLPELIYNKKNLLNPPFLAFKNGKF